MKTLRELWSCVTGHSMQPKRVAPEVIIHDPAAEQPRDLDDPFFDSEVQSRMAAMIAGQAVKKNAPTDN